MTESTTIHIAALGRSGVLGDCYNCVTDSFCGYNVFRTRIPDSIVTKQRNWPPEFKFHESSNISAKFTKMDVAGDLRASVIAGLVKVEGSGKYLQEQESSCRSVRTTLQYTIRTVNESINIFDENLEPLISEDILETKEATHVVVGVELGANSLITLESKNRKNDDTREIKVCMLAELERLQAASSGNATVTGRAVRSDKRMEYSWTLSVFVDVWEENADLPRDTESALTFMRRLPMLLRKEGTGRPLAFTLLPISTIVNKFKLTVDISAHVNRLDADCETIFVEFHEKTAESMLKIDDLWENVQQYQLCIPDAKIHSVSSLKSHFAHYVAKVREELRVTLLKVRQGLSNSSEFSKIQQKYLEGGFSSGGVNIALKAFDPLCQKINLVTNLAKEGVEYVQKDRIVEDVVRHSSKTTVVAVFRGSTSLKETDPVAWNTCIELLYDLADHRNILPPEHTPTKLLFVDGDVHHYCHIDKVKISLVRKGRRIVDDLEKYLKSLAQFPLTRSVCPAERVGLMPSKLMRVEWRCPGSYSHQLTRCGPENYLWVCEKCSGSILYGSDDHFYCDCGRAPQAMFLYRCPDKKHGYEYVALSPEGQKGNISALQDQNEIYDPMLDALAISPDSNFVSINRGMIQWQ